MSWVTETVHRRWNYIISILLMSFVFLAVLVVLTDVLAIYLFLVTVRIFAGY